MKRPNTQKHWTALAVARYYERNDTACRARDLYRYVSELFDKPDQLVWALTKLDDEDTIDHIVVKSPTKDGGRSNTYAYYPTPITIEELRDLGEPTELPDGSPIPDTLDPSIPTKRVSAEEADSVPAPESESFGLKYETMTGPPRSRSSEGALPPRDYDASGRSQSPDAVIEITDDPDPATGDDSDEEAAESDDNDETPIDTSEDTDTDNDAQNDAEAVCDYCGQEFASAHGVDVHLAYCPEYDPDADEVEDEDQDEEDSDDSAPFECEHCSRTFDSKRGRSVHTTKSHPDDEDEDESEADTSTEDAAADIPVEVAEFDDPTNIDPEHVPRRPGAFARSMDWNSIANRLERRAAEAHDEGLTEIAAAYSQFAVLAMDGDLERRIALILLGNPVLDLEDQLVMH